jgi:tRNA threonylcarbamoyladenosine biosynthesis protein TsaE
MEDFGGKVLATAQMPAVIYLCGELGTGKTTFVRGALRSLGYQGLVKSPTFTVVESYSLNQRDIHHFDLYRISDPEELDFIGIRDYASSRSILFFEWPEKGQAFIPPATLKISLRHAGSSRLAEIERYPEIL